MDYKAGGEGVKKPPIREQLTGGSLLFTVLCVYRHLFAPHHMNAVKARCGREIFF